MGLFSGAVIDELLFSYTYNSFNAIHCSVLGPSFYIQASARLLPFRFAKNKNTFNVGTDTHRHTSQATPLTSQEAAALISSELWTLLATYVQVDACDPCVSSLDSLKATLARCQVLGELLEAAAFVGATTVPSGWPSKAAHSRLTHARDGFGYKGALKKESSANDGSGDFMVTRCKHRVGAWQQTVRQAAMHAYALALALGML